MHEKDNMQAFLQRAITSLTFFLAFSHNSYLIWIIFLAETASCAKLHSITQIMKNKTGVLPSSDELLVGLSNLAYKKNEKPPDKGKKV